MPKNLKIFSLIAACGVLGAVFWYLLYQVLYQDSQVIEISSLIPPAIIFLVWAISTALLFLISVSFGEIFWLFLVLGALFILLFGINYYNLPGAVLFLILIFLGWRTIRIEKQNRIKMRLMRILPRGLPAFFTAVALMVALAYFFSPSLQGEVSAIKIPREIFDIIIKPIEKLVIDRVPLYKKGMTANEFLLITDITQNMQDPGKVSPKLLQELHKKGFLEEKGMEMKEFLQNKELAEIIKKGIEPDLENPEKLEKLRKEYSEKLGVSIEETDSFNDLLYKLANSQINAFRKTYGEALPVALAIGLFLTIKAVSWPIMWAIIFITILIFKLFIALKLIRIEEVEVKKEIITL